MLAALLALLPAAASADGGEEAWLAANLDSAARYVGRIESCMPGFSSAVPPADEGLTGALRCTFRAIEARHGPEAAAEELARAKSEGRTPLAFLLGLSVPQESDLRLAESEEVCRVFEAALASPMMTALADRVGGGCGSVW